MAHRGQHDQYKSNSQIAPEQYIFRKAVYHTGIVLFAAVVLWDPAMQCFPPP
jgi:hypothetical protein